MRKYIDVPNKSVRDQIVSILGKGNITFDRNSMPECNYIEESNYPKIRHLIDVPSLEKATSYKGNPEAEFKAFLETHNVFINGYPIMNGKKHPLVTKNKVWGQYCGYLDGKPNGWFRDFTADEFHQCDFTGEVEGVISKAEIAQKNYEKFISDAQKYREVGRKAKKLYDEMGTDNTSNAYIEKKQVKLFNAKLTKDLSAMISIKNIEGYFTQLQFIDPNGKKTMLGEGKVMGSFHQMGFINKYSTIILCEGWATGATLYEHLKHPTICAIHSGNLPLVAEVLKKKYPNNKFVIAADNDRFQKNAPVNINGGVKKAEEAKEILGEEATVITPEFVDIMFDEERHDLIDWNDFYIEYGLDDFLKEAGKFGVKPRRIRKSLRNESISS